MVKDFRFDTYKLERLFGFIYIERIPMLYRSKRCRVLIRGLKYGEHSGFTHLIYLIRRNGEVVCVIGGIRNIFDVKKDYSGYVYLSKDFFFPNVSYKSIFVEKEYHAFRFALLEVEDMVRYSHVMRNGRSLLGKFMKIHSVVYSEMNKKVVEKNVIVENSTQKYSFSSALENKGSRNIVKLEED